MAGSSKKPGIKDLSDLKARLGLKKEEAAPAAEPEAAEPEAPAAAAAPAAAVPTGAAPTGGAPAGNPFAAPPAGNPFAPPPAAAVPAGVPTGAAPSGLALEDDEDEDDDDYEDDDYDDDDDIDAEPSPFSDEPDLDANAYDPSVKEPASPLKMISIVIVLGLVGGLGLFSGLTYEEISRKHATAAERVETAKTLYPTIQKKLRNWETFFKPFDAAVQSAGGPQMVSWDESLHQNMVTYVQGSNEELDFLINAKDLPEGTGLLSTLLKDSEDDPLFYLRTYILYTRILDEQIRWHVKATETELAELKELSGLGGTEKGGFAVKFDEKAYNEMLTGFGSFEPAEEPVEALPGEILKLGGLVGVQELFEGEGKEMRLKENSPWHQHFRAMGVPDEGLPGVFSMLYRVKRDPNAEPAPEPEPKEDEGDEDEDGEAPAGGVSNFVTTTEVVLVTKEDLMGAGENAVSRYEGRILQILTTMKKIRENTEQLEERLKRQASEELE